MKYGISTRRGLPTSVAVAGLSPGEGAANMEFGPALRALAESEHEDERVDLAALAELVEFARSPL